MPTTTKTQKNFVDSGLAAEVVLLEKEFGYGITGEDQMDLTPYQKSVLMLEHQRQEEEKQKQSKGGAGGSPQGALNARHPDSEGYTEEHSYTNANEFETENQVEFVDT